MFTVARLVAGQGPYTRRTAPRGTVNFAAAAKPRRNPGQTFRAPPGSRLSERADLFLERGRTSLHWSAIYL
eukprot:371643-Hanusia_phi.AAC.1